MLESRGLFQALDITATGGLSDLVVVQTGNGPRLVAVGVDGGGMMSFALTNGGTPAKVDTDLFVGEAALGSGAGGAVLTTGSSDFLVHSLTAGDTLALTTLTAGGGFGATQTVQLGSAGAPGAMASARMNGDNFVFLATGEDRTLSVLRDTSGGTALSVDASLTTEVHISGISAIETVRVGGTDMVIVASNTAERVFALTVDSKNGVLREAGSIGAFEGLGIGGLNGLAVAQAGGTHYVLAAGTTSGSISVLALADDGTLRAVDHVLDSLYTRFDDIASLAVTEVEGQSFVLAAGTDGGVSLLTMLPGGRLVHLETGAAGGDFPVMSLSHFTGVSVGDEIQFFAAGEAGGNILQFAVSTADLGQVIAPNAGGTGTGGAGDDQLIGNTGSEVLSGGGGDDVLTDGAGSDTLTGGTGADRFVMTFDQTADLITDFQAGVDALDLSAWPMLYSTGALSFAQTATGGQITYRGEVLTVQSADYNPLTLAQILPDGITGFSRPFLFLSSDPVDQTGGGGRDWIYGRAGDDSLRGGGDRDHLWGRDGADQIWGGAGDDEIFGEAGDDTLWGEDGDDTILGGAGDDQIDGQGQRDWIDAGAGNDIVWGGSGRDKIKLGDGNDIFYDDDQEGYQGGDYVQGWDGDDQIFGAGGDDTLYGDNGDDLIYGGVGDDKIFGGSGRDWIDAGDGNDTVWGGDGRDKIKLGNGDDVFKDTDQDGYQGADYVQGWDGNDILNGKGGDDTLYGDNGDDTIRGGAGNDKLFGGQGYDWIDAGDGDDTVWGGDGVDTVYLGDGDDIFKDTSQTGTKAGDTVDGGAGNDRFKMGGGNDWLTGGSGQDVFIFALNAEDDTITDFAPGEDTLKFEISGLNFAALGFVDDGLGTLISHPGGTIYLEGVGAADLSISDFAF